MIGYFARVWSAAAVADGVVIGGYFSETGNRGTSSGGGVDFAVIKLLSDGTVSSRLQVAMENRFRGARYEGIFRVPVLC